MDIREQVARELCRMETGCGVHWDECIENDEREMYLVKADQIIPLVRADIQRDTVALLKNLRRDIWLIRGMAKSKSMFPYDMCREILSITKQSLEDIRSELKSGTFKEGE